MKSYSIYLFSQNYSHIFCPEYENDVAPVWSWSRSVCDDGATIWVQQCFKAVLTDQEDSGDQEDIGLMSSVHSRPGVRRQPNRLLWQSLDRCAKEDDRQAATCSQCCGPNHLQHKQVRLRVESVPATRAPLAECRWPGLVQSVCPGVQVSTQPGAWIRYSANLCPALLVVVTYARLVVAISTFHVLILLRMGDGRLPTPVPHLGTLYQTVSRTLISLCKPSNAISELLIFHILVHFSAFEVSYKNTLYKSTVIIIIIINDWKELSLATCIWAAPDR